MWAACSNGHVEIAKLLINAGADVNKTNWVIPNDLIFCCKYKFLGKFFCITRLYEDQTVWYFWHRAHIHIILLYSSIIEFFEANVVSGL